MFPKCLPLFSSMIPNEISIRLVSLVVSLPVSLLPSFPRSLAWLSCRLSNCHPCLGCRRGAPGSSVASCDCHEEAKRPKLEEASAKAASSDSQGFGCSRLLQDRAQLCGSGAGRHLQTQLADASDQSSLVEKLRSCARAKLG